MNVRRRVARLNEQFRREISRLLRDAVKDPRIGFATITAVEVAPDLSIARAFVSVGGGNDARAESLRGLRAAAPFIRAALGRELHLRRIPEIRFELDETLHRAMRIEKLLSEVTPAEEPKSDPTSDGEADPTDGPPTDDA